MNQEVYFKLLFEINKQKIKANGETSIMGRITIDGKVAQYSTGLSIAPSDWNATKAGQKIKAS